MTFETQIKILKKPKLNKPILIEGLPGLGLVGRIAAEYLINELKAVKFAELYSPDFPPQYDIQKDGTGKMRKIDFYYYKAKNKKQKDAIILIGDDQGLTVQSQYVICDLILNTAEKFNCSFIFTLGGYGLQKLSKNPRVFGCASDKKIVKKFAKQKVLFGKVGGAIVGAAGLLVGMGDLHKIPGICLMGETHGNFVDPRAAKNVLKIVIDYLGVKINLKGLDKKARETEEMISKLQSMQKTAQQTPQQVKPLDPGHLSYIR